MQAQASQSSRAKIVRILTFCNKAASKLTGYEREEMVGRNCKFMQGRRTQGAAVRAFSKAVREAQPAVVVVTNFRKDGSEFSNLVALQPVFGPGGYLYNVAIQVEYDESVTSQVRYAQQTSPGLPGLAWPDRPTFAV